MDGYLVMLHHTMDDVPVQFCDDWVEAEQVANAIDPMPSNELRATIDTDCSTPVCVSIVEFQDGRPVSRTVVRDVE